MKARYIALLALLCIAAGAVRPALAQECGSRDNGTCVAVKEDQDTGCCVDDGECKETSDEQAASLDDGICRTRFVVDIGETNPDAECVQPTATLCNPGSTTEPAGCTVSKCYITVPPVGAEGKADWTSAVKGDEGTNEMATCYRGLNYEVEGTDGKVFSYEGGVPTTMAITAFKALTISAPSGGQPRAGFRVSRFNVTLEGNFTVGYTTTLVGGGNEDGLVHLPEPVNGFVLPEGHTRVPVTRFTLTNKGEDGEGVLHVHRVTINVC